MTPSLISLGLGRVVGQHMSKGSVRVNAENLFETPTPLGRAPAHRLVGNRGRREHLFEPPANPGDLLRICYLLRWNSPAIISNSDTTWTRKRPGFRP